MKILLAAVSLALLATPAFAVSFYKAVDVTLEIDLVTTSGKLITNHDNNTTIIEGIAHVSGTAVKDYDVVVNENTNEIDVIKKSGTLVGAVITANTITSSIGNTANTQENLTYASEWTGSSSYPGTMYVVIKLGQRGGFSSERASFIMGGTSFIYHGTLSTATKEYSF